MSDRQAKLRLERMVRRRDMAWKRWIEAEPYERDRMIAWVEEPRTRLMKLDRRRRLRFALDIGFGDDIPLPPSGV